MSSVTVYQERNSNGLLVILLIVSIIAFALLSAHAIVRHGSDAVYVNTCQIKNGNHSSFFNSDTSRTANIICLDNGKYGIEICDSSGNQITCFIKEKMKTIDQVYNYLKNRGYH